MIPLGAGPRDSQIDSSRNGGELYGAADDSRLTKFVE